MRVTGIGTGLFIEGESLIDFISKNIVNVEEGAIIAITSKIVALSQGRVCGIRDKEMFLRQESKEIIETPWEPLTLTNDGWCINAGMDESNADSRIILMPGHSFEVAENIRSVLRDFFSIDRLGIIITDTKSVPLRVGTIGRAIGYAGFEPLKSYIGRKDLFDRKSRVTESNVADALAAAAVLMMGEGDERVPLAIIDDAPVSFVSGPVERKTLSLLPENDIFSYVFARVKKEVPRRLRRDTVSGR